MRMHFRTLTRPKHLAEHLSVVFPALSHMQTQEWASQILGYRNWHELSKSVGPTVEETSDHIVSVESMTSGNWSDEDRAFFKRGLDQREVLERLIGEPMPGMDTLFLHVDPNFTDVRFKKLGKTGKGSPCFRGFEYDLFQFEGETPGAGGGCRHNGSMMGDSIDIYLGLPLGVDEDDLISRLTQRMRTAKVPFRGYDADLEITLRGSHFGITQFDIEPYDDYEPDKEIFLASQTRSYRFFLLENESPIGAAVLKIWALASSDSNDISVEVTVDEAWTALETQEVFDALVMSLAGTVCEPLRRLMWFRVLNPGVSIEVDFLSESESQLTWALVRELESVVPGSLLADEAEMSEAGLAGLKFRGTIAP
ncbi:hypothetical protein G3O06_01165 [Burkholderia sp. Ac-20345]|uniref:hypothetical protein n=1 Tax=Burkholderia sp. Ac-20345 TaxID=2703891 RepID=UPI00197C515D|nr:hypothetical protein [Burkholderia sp. Ac-20345]MBN3776174.1 hypothetical protein [Burkholderia sp. Ac-20345]